MAEFDLLLRGGTLIDGTGAARPRRRRHPRCAAMAAVGDLARASAAPTEIEATGRIVAPGFIDSHTHDDRYLSARPRTCRPS